MPYILDEQDRDQKTQAKPEEPILQYGHKQWDTKAIKQNAYLVLIVLSILSGWLATWVVGELFKDRYAR